MRLFPLARDLTHSNVTTAIQHSTIDCNDDSSLVFLVGFDFNGNRRVLHLFDAHLFVGKYCG